MIKIAICDDEKNAREALESKLIKLLSLKNTKHDISLFQSSESLLNCKEHFDILFLDIRMDGENGIETAKKLREKKVKCLIIFVTCLKEYVFDAFDVNAANYLLKPIDEKKLEAVLDKALLTVEKDSSEYLVLQSNQEIEKIKLSEIFYAEVLNHSVFLYTSSEIKNYNKKIESLERELNEDFFRCHRSYILNFKFVKSYKKGLATLISGEIIPVAKRRQQEFCNAFLLFQRKEVR